MDSDSALRALAAIAQGSLALAGLMLVATTFYLSRSKKSYSMLAGERKTTWVDKVIMIFMWSMIIVVPVAAGLWTAYLALQLMLTIPSNVVLSDDMAAQVRGVLKSFSALLFYVGIDTVMFVLFLPFLESMSSKRRKPRGSVKKKDHGKENDDQATPSDEAKV
jgi:hypothetical protein